MVEGPLSEGKLRTLTSAPAGYEFNHSERAGSKSLECSPQDRKFVTQKSESARSPKRPLVEALAGRHSMVGQSIAVPSRLADKAVLPVGEKSTDVRSCVWHLLT